MAISVSVSAFVIQPVYQPFYYSVTSSNYTQPQFRFVFDVYKDGVFVERIKTLPKIGTNGANFSPARILESYLSYDNPYAASSIQTQTNMLCQYQINYGEEYGPISAAPVLYPNLANSSGYTFNGTVQYKDYNYSQVGYTWDKYILKNISVYGGNGYFLTNSPTELTIGIDDNHTLSCFNFKATDIATSTAERVFYLNVKAYQNSGTTTTSKYQYTAVTLGNTVIAKELTLPAGPNDLSAIPIGNYVSGPNPPINTNTDYKYEIYLSNSADTTISQTKTFTFQSCSKYDTVRIMFLNRLGAWDYFNFTLVSRDTININKTIYKKNIPITYYYGTTFMDRENTVLDSNVMKTKKVTSNWLTDEESTWLEELFTSPEVYEVIEDPFAAYQKKFIPVVVTTTSQEIKKRVNDNIYNYELEFSYASEVNVQRN
jgi:hypothetical protein